MNAISKFFHKLLKIEYYIKPHLCNYYLNSWILLSAIYDLKILNITVSSNKSFNFTNSLYFKYLCTKRENNYVNSLGLFASFEEFDQTIQLLPFTITKQIDSNSTYTLSIDESIQLIELGLVDRRDVPIIYKLSF